MNNSDFAVCIVLADEMNQANEELRDTIRCIWPLQAKKMLDLLIPRNEGKIYSSSLLEHINNHRAILFSELGRDKLTVGKIYVCLLIFESWRSKSKPSEQVSRAKYFSYEKLQIPQRYLLKSLWDPSITILLFESHSRLAFRY